MSEVVASMPRRRGFALVITVLLLALLVLVLVALATLTRVETSVAGNTRKFSQARQNALLALNEALARLQKTAGPDQRVTATAEIAGATDEVRKWTGVWKSDGTFVDWLASGSEGSSSGPSYSVSVIRGQEMVGDATSGTENDVEAGLLEIKVAPYPGMDPNLTPTVGRYAWWVGDEGVKARVNLVDPYRSSDSASSEATIRNTVAQRVAGERALSGYPLNADALERVLTVRQFSYVSGTSEEEIAGSSVAYTTVRDRFHDITAVSAGVLCDVRDGGLKKDLSRVMIDGAGPSDSTALFSGGPTWSKLRAFHELRPDVADTDTSIGSMAPRSDASGSCPVHPVLTAVMVEATIYTVIDTSEQTWVALRPTVVMANPYDVALSGGRYRITIHNVNPDSDGGGGLSGEDTTTSTQLFYGPPDAYGEILTGVHNADLVLEVPLAETGFEPGEVKGYELEADAYGVSSGLSLTTGIGGAFAVRRHCEGDLGTENSVLLKLHSGEVNLTLSFLESGSWVPIQTVTKVSAQAASRTFAPPDAVPDFENRVAQVFFLNGSVGPSASRIETRWLAQHNPRAAAATYASSDAWGQNPCWSGIDPDSVDGEPITAALWGPTFGSGGAAWVSLFRIPRQNLLSIAEFQHADLSLSVSRPDRCPAYGVGNSYASPYVAAGSADFSYSLNDALWDPFFLSGFPTATVPDEVPNSRLVPYAETTATSPTYDEAAAMFMVSGAFNVNSTSKDAWAAMLGSLNRTTVRVYDPGEETFADLSTVANPFFRTANVTGTIGGTPWLEGWRGLRSLSSDEIDALATLLVDQVRRRGPFLSLASFVNRDLATSAESEERLMGALQSALDGIRAGETAVDGSGTTLPTPGINPGTSLPSTENASAPSGLAFPAAAEGNLSACAPGWVTQADVLTALGPVLSARSDTFVIRAYGEAVNPVLDPSDPRYVEGKAWCEAVVQRVPDYVDSDGNDPWDTSDLTTTNATLGRRFIITQFRWLTENDI